MFDTVIRSGTIATASEQFKGDVAIADGRIVALGRGIGSGRQEISAEGKLVLPGGIDSHCHIEEPVLGPAALSGDFAGDTAAAAFGGTTSVICFIPQFKGEPLLPRAKDYREKARRSLIDYSFHAVVSDPTETVLREELPRLIDEGIGSIKVYSTYESSALNDEAMLDVFSVAKRAGALVVVHAENDGMIKWLTRDLARRGLTLPKHHALAKPAVVEREAIHHIIALAEMLNQPIQIFHVSSAEGADEIRRAQRRGVRVFAETCPHYLAFTAEDLNRPGFEGAKYLCSPALRTCNDQEALWQAIRDGVIGVVSSDHASWDYEGPKGKRVAGPDAPFFDIPNGMPGVETRLPVLFSEGVGKRRIDLQTFVALTAANPAKLFGLYPTKGTITPGADADIAIWDPQLARTVQVRNLHGACDYTPFEGMTFTGWPIMTLVRGKVVVANGRQLVEPGHGRFLPRGQAALASDKLP